jgi:hypothetical protein
MIADESDGGHLAVLKKQAQPDALCVGPNRSGGVEPERGYSNSENGNSSTDLRAHERGLLRQPYKRAKPGVFRKSAQKTQKVPAVGPPRSFT